MGGDDERIPVRLNIWPEDAESEEAVVVNWFAREGASVEADATLCEVQVDKVSVDVLAPAAGTLDEIVCDEDDVFGPEDAIAWLAPRAGTA